MTNPDLKLAYAPAYDIRLWGLEQLHPFDARKFSRAWRLLSERFGDALDSRHLLPTDPVTDEMLARVHARGHMKLIYSSAYVASALEVPVARYLPYWLLSNRVVHAMRLATRGTVMCAEAALGGDCAVNIGGGFHHAGKQRAHGFCLFNDIGVAVAEMRALGKLAATATVAVIDLDAHQGDGLESVFLDDSSVRILDMYNADIFPADLVMRERIDEDIPLRSGTDDNDYLSHLRERLPAFLDAAERPQLAFYNAGTDILDVDPLGGLGVSYDGVLARDRFVFDSLRARGIPFVMTTSGGYTDASHRLIADSVSSLIETMAAVTVSGAGVESDVSLPT